MQHERLDTSEELCKSLNACQNRGSGIGGPDYWFEMLSTASSCTERRGWWLRSSTFAVGCSVVMKEIAKGTRFLFHHGISLISFSLSCAVVVETHPVARAAVPSNIHLHFHRISMITTTYLNKL